MSDKGLGEKDTPVKVVRLTRRFGRKMALDAVSLELPPGKVFGLVGENGAGKTTLIRHLMGLLKPHEGFVRVFGLDPVEDPENTLVRIGYLSENRDLPPWMRVRELLLFMKPFYPRWDSAYAQELREMFDIDPNAKIRTLSRGQRAQVGLTVALAHRPPLLILDEPSSGLDPVVRRDILTAIIRTVADEGRTVLFSSHLLDEVECVADYVAMLHQGKLVCSAPLEEMKAQYRLVTVRTPDDFLPPLEHALGMERDGNEWSFLWNNDLEALRARLAHTQASIIEDSAPSLDDILVSHVRTKRNASKARKETVEV